MLFVGGVPPPGGPGDFSTPTPATLAKVWDEANRGASPTFPAGVDYTVPANRRAQLYAYAEAHPSIAFDAGQTGEIDLQVTPAGGALATTVLLRWNGAGLDAETRLGQGVPLDLGPGDRVDFRVIIAAGAAQIGMNLALYGTEYDA